MATRRKKLSNTTKLFIVIAIALAVIIISGGFPEAAQFYKPVTKCTDTDKGFNTAVQGTCTGKDGKFTDYCVSSSEVMEYVCTGLYCTNDAEVMSCPYGCSNGACITPTLNLKYYPWPFVQASTWTGLIVVGSAAPTSDVVSAVDIATMLAQDTGGGMVPVAKLDTEVTQSDKTGKNLILVGSKGINRLVAEVEGVPYVFDPYYTMTQCAVSGAGCKALSLRQSIYASDKAILIVNGDSAIDTSKAAKILKDYKTYKADGTLFGTNCKVKDLNGTLSLNCT